MSSSSDITATLQQLQDFCSSISDWTAHSLPQALYRAPVIDWHHPDDYTQKGVAGLRKFQSTAEAERDHVAGLVASPIRSKEFNSNAPHLITVWDEFVRSGWPLSAISQTMEVEGRAGVKVDVIAKGGAEWVKVNTIKEARLLAEFREQDSYINSDYDSDTSSPGAGPSRLSIPVFTNSLIVQGEALLYAAKAYPRPSDRPAPTVRLVLTRLLRPSAGFVDDRTDRTVSHLQSLGIVVQLGPSSGHILSSSPHTHLQPTRNIVLDLSVLVALCCESTHYPLPSHPDEFESRFRSLRLNETTGKVELGDHTNTSKDLRDQLQWEAQHPLIQEMKDRLGEIAAGDGGTELRFWITEEVRDRLPGLVDIIGGPSERRRGTAILRGEDEASTFWEGSRWEGNEGVLKDLRIRILPSNPEPDSPVSAFQLSLSSSCQSLLFNFDNPPPPESMPAGKKKPPRRSRVRPSALGPTSRSPSGHTIRTMMAGAERGWTVLSNNRGAVGKVIREMGVGEGMCGEASSGRLGGAKIREKTNGGKRQEVAAIWVVNPSSLSEWRRLEVLRENEKLQAGSAPGGE